MLRTTRTRPRKFQSLCAIPARYHFSALKSIWTDRSNLKATLILVFQTTERLRQRVVAAQTHNFRITRIRIVALAIESNSRAHV